MILECVTVLTVGVGQQHAEGQGPGILEFEASDADQRDDSLAIYRRGELGIRAAGGFLKSANMRAQILPVEIRSGGKATQVERIAAARRGHYRSGIGAAA